MLIWSGLQLILTSKIGLHIACSFNSIAAHSKSLAASVFSVEGLIKMATSFHEVLENV